MEPITLTSDWSAPITVPASSLLQNVGSSAIEVRRQSATGASLRIPSGQVYETRDAEAVIVARAFGSGTLLVIEGF